MHWIRGLDAKGCELAEVSYAAKPAQSRLQGHSGDAAALSVQMCQFLFWQSEPMSQCKCQALRSHAASEIQETWMSCAHRLNRCACDGHGVLSSGRAARRGQASAHILAAGTPLPPGQGRHYAECLSRQDSVVKELHNAGWRS